MLSSSRLDYSVTFLASLLLSLLPVCSLLWQKTLSPRISCWLEQKSTGIGWRHQAKSKVQNHDNHVKKTNWSLAGVYLNNCWNLKQKKILTTIQMSIRAIRLVRENHDQIL